MASVRGLLVYHLGLNPSLVYSLSAISIIILSLVAIKYLFVKNQNDPLFTIRKAISYNYKILSVYTLFYLIFVGLSEIADIYFFILFPIIFLLIKFKTKYLESAVHIISIVIVIGTYIFYQLGVNFGFDAIEAANLTLRPGELAYSRIGENLLPGGYLGSHHDNANLLIMSATFYFSLAIDPDKKPRYIYWLLFCLVLVFTILTGSASNILSMAIVLIIAIILYAKKLLLLIVPIAIYNYELFEEKLYFLNKITQDQSDLTDGGMFNSLNFNSIIKSTHSIIFGGGYYFEVPMIKSEVAFIKILIGFGIIPFLILMFILFSPIYYCYLFNKKCKKKVLININLLSPLQIKQLKLVREKHLKRLIIATFPILTGTLSLLHYGSLFRITSIGLFCLLITLFYKKYLDLSTNFDNLVSQNFILNKA
jgi:hypothetical protein